MLTYALFCLKDGSHLGDTQLSLGNTGGWKHGVGNVIFLHLSPSPTEWAGTIFCVTATRSLSQENAVDDLADISDLVIVTLAKHTEL